MLATALAMIDAVHLLVIKRFNDRFLTSALATPLDPSHVGRNFVCRQSGVGVGVRANARSPLELVRCSQRSGFLSPGHCLGSPAPAASGCAVASPRLTFRPTGRSPQAPALKGKAKVHPKGKAAPKKKSIADRWDPSWATHIDAHELCKKFGLGKCKNKNCHFLSGGHRCPVPDAAGNPCGQAHSAVEHLSAGH